MAADLPRQPPYGVAVRRTSRSPRVDGVLAVLELIDFLDDFGGQLPWFSDGNEPCADALARVHHLSGFVDAKQPLAVTTAADAEQTREQRVKDAFFIVEPNREQLTRISRMIDAGKLRVFVGAPFPLQEASQAYARKPVRGKNVLVVDR